MKIGVVEDFDTWVSLDDVRIAGTCASDDFVIQTPNIGGIGLPDAKFTDAIPIDRDGAVSPADHSQTRTVIVPIMWQRDTAAEAMQSLRTLKGAWQPRKVDDVLEVSIPGIGPSDDIMRFWGRPRSTLDVNLQALPGGIIFALATFVALDPIGYGPEITVSGTGTFTVDNPGDAPTRRAIIEIVGNGGAPLISNVTDGGADVVMTDVLAGGQSWFIDLYRRTVVDAAGNDVFPGNVSATSLWPRLLPGSNTITLTGAASAELTYRSGWW